MKKAVFKATRAREVAFFTSTIPLEVSGDCTPNTNF